MSNELYIHNKWSTMQNPPCCALCGEPATTGYVITDDDEIICITCRDDARASEEKWIDD